MTTPATTADGTGARTGGGDGCLLSDGCLLEVDSVRFAYPGGEEVLRGVSLRLEHGIRLGLAGPNGAGKSTLLRVAAGLLRPRAGEVRLDGRALHAIPRMELARLVGWVPQEAGTSFPFTAGEVVLMGRYPHQGPFGFESERDREIALACLAEVGIEHLADRPLGALSGGEKRRAVIASALAQEPSVLLLDEPAAGLDLAAQVALAGILESLAAKGLAVAVISHDLNLAARLCDRIALMKAGEIVAEGEPGSVLTEERLTSLYGTRVRVSRYDVDGLPLVFPAFKTKGNHSRPAEMGRETSSSSPGADPSLPKGAARRRPAEGQTD